LGDLVTDGKLVLTRLSRKWFWGFLLNLYGSGWARESTNIKFSRKIPLYEVRVTDESFFQKRIHVYSVTFFKAQVECLLFQ